MSISRKRFRIEQALIGEDPMSMPVVAEGDAGAASARTYQHIMGADPVKEVSG